MARKPAPKASPRPAGKGAPKRPEKPASVIYIGPTLPHGRLVSMTVYRGELPRYLTALISECPEIADCLIPVKNFPAVSGTLKASTSPAGLAFRAVMKRFGAVAGGEPEGQPVSRSTPYQDYINLKLGVR